MCVKIFTDAIESAQNLSIEDQKEFYFAYVNYAQNGTEYTGGGIVGALFIAYKDRIDAYKHRCAVNRANATKSKTNQKRTQSESKANAKRNASESEAKAERIESESKANEQAKAERKAPRDRDIDRDIEKEEKESTKEKEEKDTAAKPPARLIAPTVEEVDEYLASMGLSEFLSGAEFVGYYDSQGWRKANGQKVTSWKSAASGWAARERKRNAPKAEAAPKYDFADLDKAVMVDA